MAKTTLKDSAIEMTAATLRISTKTVAIIVNEYQRIHSSLARAQKKTATVAKKRSST